MNFIQLPDEIAFGVKKVCTLIGDQRNVSVSFHKEEALTIRAENDTVHIGYRRPSDAFRAVSFVNHFDGTPIIQTPKFKRLCALLDCSHNAVLKPSAVKEFIVHLAMLGFTTLILNLTNTFEIPAYPYYGHLRGRYTKAQLRDFVCFGEQMDIEVIPYVAVPSPDAETVYPQMDAMFQTLRDCFSSPLIHIDPAACCQSPDLSDILSRITAIAEPYHFTPVFWGDLLSDSPFPGQVALCHTAKFLQNETALARLSHDRENWFAGECRMGDGYCPKNHFSLWITPGQLHNAEQYGFQNIIAACNGGDGTECTLFNLLPSLLQYAELCWSQADAATLNARSLDCFAMPFSAFCAIDVIGYYGKFSNGMTVPPAYEKAVLYGDPLIGTVHRDIIRGVAVGKYAKDVSTLQRVIKDITDYRYQYLFDTQLRLAKLLDAKFTFSVGLRQAYRENDRRELRRLTAILLPHIIDLLDSFMEAYRFQWHQNNKPFGFEVIDLRLGGLKQRLLSSKIRLEQYLDGKLDLIEELEQPDLPPDGIDAAPHETAVRWRQAASANELI